ncbi:hypothetical protein CYPRO_2789 [Cyclonatronum proteinivorum]|uniref:Outer membrane protein beta-barrel domain-containing protein n=1 Tax=Cyclonatronum proteinivorum TaxID=1457365 RepID=A0A345UNH6_9BACT|nr:hypothetical protein [Cyclonatronum proteinivorum]AXJ02028.1 hypothetical protein CYPRO_2789 [Cyclonatronum proteinivorum]
MKSPAALFCTLLLALLLADDLQAQMFSVSAGTQRQQLLLTTPSSAGTFLEFADFSLFGSIAEHANIPDYSFDGVLYGLYVRTPGLVFQLADRTSLGPEEDIRATFASLGLLAPATIRTGRTFRIGIPFGLSTDYTLVRTRQTANTSAEFAQNSVYISAGLDFLFQLTQRVQLHAVSQPSIGFTVGSYGATGGASYKLTQDVFFNVTQLAGIFGLQAGYTAAFYRFSNSDAEFRYDWSSHRLRLALTF